jgi:hypothetical protein
MESNSLNQEQLNLAIAESEQQIQPDSFNINTYYTQHITAYGNGFFDTDTIVQKESCYDADSFNNFIDNIKRNINNIYDYDFLTDNPQVAQEFIENCETIKLKYTTTLELANDDEKEIALKQLKNNLLTELGVYEVFVEKCNEINIADIEDKALKYAEYLSTQEDPKILTTQQNKEFVTKNQQPAKIDYPQQDFNEFFRYFIDISKVEGCFQTTKEGESLIAELNIGYIDSIETAETLYPKEAKIRRAPVNGVEGQVLANIDDPFNKFQYSITDENSADGKTIKKLLEDIENSNSKASLLLQIQNEGFVFESTNTTISIKENSDPSFFSIPINRTQYVDGQATKNDKAIKFNDKFTISQRDFELTDIIMHGGESSNGGHYYTISKREIELTNGQKHIVFLQHNDDETKCFMKFGNEIQYINIEDVEGLVGLYEFATLADIKESERIEQNFANIIYQKKIPSSKINETYTGLNNYENSCYINSFLAVVAGMNDGSEKQLLLAKLKEKGIKFSDNKFSSINKETDIQDLINILRINQGENQVVPYNPNVANKTEQKTRKKPEIFDQTNNKIESIPKNEIQPSFFSRICDFFASLDPFSSCRGN